MKIDKTKHYYRMCRQVAIEGDVKYNLRECIDSISEDTLGTLLCLYSLVQKGQIASSSIEEKKKMLEKGILDSFGNLLKKLSKERVAILREASSNRGIVNKLDEMFIITGMCFIFKKNDEFTLVIPKEIVNLFEKTYTDELMEENMCHDVLKLLNGYTLFCGLIPREYFEELLRNYYKIDVSLDDKRIKERLAEGNISLANGYYMLDVLDDDRNKNVVDTIRKKQDDYYRIFTLREMNNELDVVSEYYDSLTNIVDDKAYGVYVNLAMLGADDSSVENYLNDLHEKFDDEAMTKLEDFWNEHRDDMRLWSLNGYTFKELDFDEQIEDLIVNMKPKKGDLESWLKSISEEHASILSNYYDVDKISKDDIIEKFKSLMNDINHHDLIELLDCDNRIMDYFFDIEDVIAGFIYICEDEGQKMMFMPTELIEICNETLDKMDVDAPNKGAFDFHIHKKEDITTSIVRGYLEMNGILRREKLQELMKVNHGIEIEIKELDNTVSMCSCGVFGEYYTFYEHDTNGMKDDLMSFLPAKDKFAKYKPYDAISIKTTYKFNNELKDYFDNCDEINDDSASSLISILNIQAHLAVYYKGLLDVTLKEENLKVSSAVKKNIEKIVKKYKNDIPVWTLNGYSLNEKNAINNSSKKVGRNDPCPCGSGKKYKKCCGK